jgi:hypothetical protein
MVFGLPLLRGAGNFISLTCDCRFWPFHALVLHWRLRQDSGSFAASDTHEYAQRLHSQSLAEMVMSRITAPSLSRSLHDLHTIRTLFLAGSGEKFS